MSDFQPIEVLLPGEVLREALEARGWSQHDFATIIGRAQSLVNAVLLGKREITPELAKAFAAAFNSSAEMWMNLESAYRLGIAKSETEPIERRAKLFAQAPVKELVRRSWIEESDDPEVLERQLKQFYGTSNFEEITDKRLAARKSTDYNNGTTPAQYAWYCRARQLAQATYASTYSPDKLKAGLADLHRWTMQPENLRTLPRVLAEIGIRLVIVEDLQNTRMDGIAFWLDPKSPAVALSLRYDRVDAFWFTLAHELIHLKYQEDEIFDVDIASDAKGAVVPKSLNESEARANEEARAVLIPNGKLDSFIARIKPLYSKMKIRQFSQVNEVHPGIVVGQLQHRKEIPFSHSREMLVPIRKYILGTTLTDGYGHIPGVINRSKDEK